MKQRHQIFCFPVFNEEQNLEKLLEKIHTLCLDLRWPHEFVVVDDASTDRSVDILESLSSRYPLTLLKHSKNQGPGAAFRTGFTWICDNRDSESVIVTMDSDGTHSLRTLQMMMQGFEAGYDVMIASVYAPGGLFVGVPFVRYALSIACNLLYRLCFPIRGIREYTGFYRAYRLQVIRDLRLAQGDKFVSRNGFASMSELLLDLRAQAVFMTEVPMIVRYDHKGGKSKMRIFSTILEHLRVLGSHMFKRNII